MATPELESGNEFETLQAPKNERGPEILKRAEGEYTELELDTLKETIAKKIKDVINRGGQSLTTYFQTRKEIKMMSDVIVSELSRKGFDVEFNHVMGAKAFELIVKW